jgi:three-Cys-motif partner protein
MPPVTLLLAVLSISTGGAIGLPIEVAALSTATASSPAAATHAYDSPTSVAAARNLAPWQDLVTFLPGQFEDHLDAILNTVGEDPAFFFLDPFGVNGIEMSLLERILQRKGTTELLIHFSDKSFKRMAGHLDDNAQRTEVGQKVADAKVAKLDAVMGSKMWRRIWLDKARTTDERIDAIQKLYCSHLNERGFKYAHTIPIRDSHEKRARYTLVFATDHPDGVDQMSDVACVYRRAQHDAHLDNGSFDLLWEQGNREDDVGTLRDDIHTYGLAAGTTTSSRSAAT